MTEVERPVFFYDFASPWSYLAAERVNGALGVVPVWQPIDRTELAGAEGQADRAAVERRARAQG
ncbi:MAG: disulfide bond formation protein DsbA, partial [Actinomycetota bacterium]|nr:disulfide bond formation protein DsbA [Actinomycetota bacterium]